VENLPEALENHVFSGLPMLTKPRFSKEKVGKELVCFFSVVAMMFLGFDVVFTMIDPQRGFLWFPIYPTELG